MKFFCGIIIILLVGVLNPGVDFLDKAICEWENDLINIYKPAWDIKKQKIVMIYYGDYIPEDWWYNRVYKQ